MKGGHGSATQDFVHYAFYKCRPEWRFLPDGQKEAGRAQFLDAVERFRDAVMMETYSTLGLRTDADFLIWKVSPELLPIQQMAEALNQTGLGRYLDLRHSLLALTRKSIYTRDEPLHAARRPDLHVRQASACGDRAVARLTGGRRDAAGGSALEPERLRTEVAGDPQLRGHHRRPRQEAVDHRERFVLDLVGIEIGLLGVRSEERR